MNEEHLRICSSAEWGKHLEETLLPWILDGTSLGEHLIEVGPGPGLTTDLLRQRVQRMTAVEYDPMLASALSSRLAGSNVEVVNADATALPMEDGQFSAAASFTMLHHIPTPELQDAMLAQLARVLKPGGVLVGVDSLDGPDFRRLHEGDICVPVNPLTFKERLERAGFTDIDLTVWRIGVKFVAHRA